MGLKDAVAALKAEDDGFLEARGKVDAACVPGLDVVEVEVPWELADRLCEWVESQGVRCAVIRGMRGEPYRRFAELVINLKLAPRPVVVPIVEEAV